MTDQSWSFFYSHFRYCFKDSCIEWFWQNCMWFCRVRMLRLQLLHAGLELKEAAIHLYPESLLLFYPPAEKQWELSSVNFYSREQYHMEITEHPEATVYEKLFDSLNMISSISSRNLWTRNQRKFCFRSTWMQYIRSKTFYSAAAPELNKYFTQSCSLIFLLLTTRSVKQQGSPCCVCPMGIPAVQIASEQPKTSSSSIPALSWEH